MKCIYHASIGLLGKKFLTVLPKESIIEKTCQLVIQYKQTRGEFGNILGAQTNKISSQLRTNFTSLFHAVSRMFAKLASGRSNKTMPPHFPNYSLYPCKSSQSKTTCRFLPLSVRREVKRLSQLLLCFLLLLLRHFLTFSFLGRFFM